MVYSNRPELPLQRLLVTQSGETFPLHDEQLIVCSRDCVNREIVTPLGVMWCVKGCKAVRHQGRKAENAEASTCCCLRVLIGRFEELYFANRNGKVGEIYVSYLYTVQV